MKKMTTAEMEEITAAGFSEFTLNDGIARINLNVNAETWTEAGAFKAANYDGGWDQDWADLEMGGQDDHLVMEEFVIEAHFDSIEDDADRELVRFKMGFEKVNGTLSADFASLTRDGDYTYRDEVGEKTYEFSDDKFMINFETDGEHGAGVYMDFGDAQQR